MVFSRRFFMNTEALVNRGISQAAASALTQSRMMKLFSHGDCVQHRKGKDGAIKQVEGGEVR